MGRSTVDEKIQNALMLGQLYKSKLVIERCEESLRAFVEEAWKVVEPGVPFVPGWHIDAICLPPETLINTSDGLMQIVDMNGYNGNVLTWNDSKKETELKPMRSWMQSKGKPLLRITCESGESVEITDNHPVYVDGRGYVRADEVRVGETLQAVRELVLSSTIKRGSCGTVVVSIERSLRQPEFVYNIETDENHNYFANGILVHNCDHLEAVNNRDIRNLIINMPPRHMKSSLVAVMWPVWTWLKNPSEQWLFASYSESLSKRDSRKCRNLIQHPWFKKHWGDRFSIVSDQNEKRRFENDKMGYRLATSVGGSNTGEGGSIIVYDDANNMKEINSEVIREGANDWHDQTMMTRLNDPRTGCRVSVQQRGHQHDMTGHLLELGGWEKLVLPARYEGDKSVTSIGWSDPRTHDGELLWPERFGPKEMEYLEHAMGPMAAAGQLQQRPAPSAGSIFERGWWNYWNPRGTSTGPVVIKNPGQEVIQKTPVEIPVAFEQVVQSWDMAFKDLEQNDFVVGHVWGRIGANVYLLNRVKGKLDFTKTIKAVRDMSHQYPCPEKLVEDKANGPAVIATLRNEIPGLIPVNPEGGKESRAQAVSPYVESGNVYLPNPDVFPWVKDLIEEYAFFPRGAHDDDVDAGTQALRRMFDSVSLSAIPEFRVIPRINEPESACHVKPSEDISKEIQPHWRRWIAVYPGSVGAALWFCETPRGSLRVYRELELHGVDAFEAGRQIAEATLPDIRAYMQSVHMSAKWNIDILMGKDAFTPIEPIGSYAELMEQGLLSYQPSSGSFDEREQVRRELMQAKFSTQMAEVEDAVFDRLRDLMRFKPVDFQPLEFNREKALKLAREDINLYTKYMAAVEGQVTGEWPKIKFSSDLPSTVAAVGAAKREDDILDPFLNALLIGICAPKSIMSAKAPVEVMWTPQFQQKMKLRRIA